MCIYSDTDIDLKFLTCHILTECICRERTIPREQIHMAVIDLNKKQEV